MLAVETNISSYNMISNDETASSYKYSLSLYSVFFLEKHVSRSYKYSLKDIKHLENDLTNSRKNKKTDESIIFSDND